jgi:hypothetical protein
MSAACSPASQAAGDSQVTFSVTVLSPPHLYNGDQEKDTMSSLAFRGDRDE